eukprot:2814832-Pyramimonas_sp.AAC.1
MFSRAAQEQDGQVRGRGLKPAAVRTRNAEQIGSRLPASEPTPLVQLPRPEPRCSGVLRHH